MSQPFQGIRNLGAVRRRASWPEFQAARFVEKFTDVVGVYLNPPDKTIVLCADEKTQVQALDRTQPALPMKKGHCGTLTHDYKRNGTTCLVAGLNVLERKVIGSCYPLQMKIRLRLPDTLPLAMKHASFNQILPCLKEPRQ